MHKLKAALLAGCLAAAAAGQAHAALITDIRIQWAAGGIPADRAIDEQVGDVLAAAPGYVNNVGWFILDLGQDFRVTRLDLFSLFDLDLVDVRASNNLQYDGFNQYLNGGETLFRGSLAAAGGDPAGVLTAKTFATPALGAYRYVQIGVATRGPGALNEIRLFDSTHVGGVPEAATWAMLTLGFAGMGYAIRRRRVAMAVA